MEHLIKPIVEPNGGSQTLYWLIFPFGKISRPVLVLSDFELENFVNQYCELHNLKIVEKD